MKNVMDAIAYMCRALEVFSATTKIHPIVSCKSVLETGCECEVD